MSAHPLPWTMELIPAEERRGPSEDPLWRVLDAEGRPVLSWVDDEAFALQLKALSEGPGVVREAPCGWTAGTEGRPCYVHGGDRCHCWKAAWLARAEPEGE